jgi:hypothetical protein
MLARNKTSAFILSVVTLFFGTLGYELLSEPYYSLKELLSTWPTGLGGVFLAALFLGIAFAFSRWFVAGMDEDAYGWKGLVRWAMCGLMIGMLLGLLYRLRPDGVEDNFLLEMLFDTALPLLICTLVFWLIFRRNFFAQVSRSSSSGPSLAAFRWFLITGGILIVGLGLFLLYHFSDSQVKGTLIAVGVELMGWCSILFGALSHSGRREAFENRLSVFAVILTLIAFIVLVTGLLWR